MSKLLSVLLAGLFATGVMAQTTTPSTTSGSGSGSTSLSGSVSGSSSTNTNNNAAVSANANTNTNSNTNTNNVNVYGPGSNKLARQQQPSGTTGTSMMPGKGNQVASPTTGAASSPTTGTTASTSGKHHAAKACPPGLERKDNGCMPPGQKKKAG